MNAWRIVLMTFAVALMGTAFAVGLRVGTQSAPAVGAGLRPARPNAVYIHGFQSLDFFDRAYERALLAEPLPLSAAVLSAHHLLVADEIARVFEALKASDGRTVVIISPNHFHRGLGRAQVSLGSWSTPYGQVDSDVADAEKLVDALPFLRYDETAFPNEHGVAALTSFVSRSLPHSKVISIIVEETLSSEDAWTLGETVASTLPDAVMVASVDMVHESSEATVAKYDPQIISTLEDGCSTSSCFDNYPIDSNSSLRALLAFAHDRGLKFALSYEGSSMRMGVAEVIADNVSHILGVLY